MLCYVSGLVPPFLPCLMRMLYMLHWHCLNKITCEHMQCSMFSPVMLALALADHQGQVHASHHGLVSFVWCWVQDVSQLTLQQKRRLFDLRRTYERESRALLDAQQRELLQASQVHALSVRTVQTIFCGCLQVVWCGERGRGEGSKRKGPARLDSALNLPWPVLAGLHVMEGTSVQPWPRLSQESRRKTTSKA